MPTIQVRDTETYYEEYGAGQPIVFLHGAGSDHRIWAERARPLADQYRVVVPDVRSHGYTGGMDREAYSFDTYVADLEAVVEALELDRPVVCGLSMGGMIALRHAAQYPDSVAGLVTLGTATPATLSRLEWFQGAVEPTLREGAATVFGPERVAAAMHWIYERIYGEETIGDVAEAERLKADHDPEVPEMSNEEAEKMGAALDDYESLAIDFGAIAVPVLALYGEREFDSMADHAERMAARIPDAEAREIPAAGHNAHVDNPTFVRDAIRTFLRERVDSTA